MSLHDPITRILTSWSPSEDLQQKCPHICNLDLESLKRKSYECCPCQSFGRHREARNMHSPWGLPSWVQFCHPATTHAAPEWRQRTPTHADPPRTHHDFFLIQISCFYVYMSQVTTSVKNSRHFQHSPRIRVQSIRRLLKSSLHCLQVLGEMTI